MEFPAANGNATARAIATIYAVAERTINEPDPDEQSSELSRLATSLELSPAALAEFQADAHPSEVGGWHDEILGMDVAMYVVSLCAPLPAVCRRCSF